MKERPALREEDRAFRQVGTVSGRLEVDAHRGLDGVVLTAGVTGGETVAHAEVEVLVGGHVADLEVAHEAARNVVVDRVGRGGAFKRVGRFRVAEAAAERDVNIGLDLKDGVWTVTPTGTSKIVALSSDTSKSFVVPAAIS